MVKQKAFGRANNDEKYQSKHRQYFSSIYLPRCNGNKTTQKQCDYHKVLRGDGGEANFDGRKIKGYGYYAICNNQKSKAIGNIAKCSNSRN
ncbi:MAG: hypothetical protein CTY17_05315 [Methylomonas sp.]|nr:MAG: hypothetical protein CTY23_08645 [Methylomonas sp.]PPD40795.1 MAG: hypothetical protein CTY17_05315 [Methylomonas sp.]